VISKTNIAEKKLKMYKASERLTSLISSIISKDFRGGIMSVSVV